MAASKASSLPHTWHGWVTSPVGKLIQAAWLIEECNAFRVHFVCELRIAKCSAIRQISKFEADALSIIRAFHVANLAIEANVWFNYVASKANIADLPSRGALGEMFVCLADVAATSSASHGEVALVLPACCRDVSRIWSTVMAQLPGYKPSVGKGRHEKRGRRHGARAAPSSSSSGVPAC